MEPRRIAPHRRNRSIGFSRWTIFIILMLLTSCQASRHTQQGTVRIESPKSEVNTTTQAIDAEQIFRQWSQNDIRNLDLHILLYDTSRLDSATQEHPLMADITMSSQSSTQATGSDTTRIETITTATTSATSSNTIIEAETYDTETEAGSPWRIYALATLIIACTAIFAWGQGWIKFKNN